MEEEVFWGTVFLDVISKGIKEVQFIVGRIVINILHISAIEFKNTETDIKVGGSHRTFFLDFSTCTTDAFFTYFANVFISCFICF